MRILSLFIVFFFNTCLLGHQYAPLDVMTDFHKVYCLEQLSNLYPDYAKDKRFSEDTKTREEFLKKNPKATIIKLDDNTKRYGLLAWLSEKQASLLKDKNSVKLQEFEKKWIEREQLHDLPENLETRTDIFLHFFKQNSDPWFLEVKHESEKYIHDIMFNHLKMDRKKFEKLADRTFRPTFDQEWLLCEILLITLSKNVQFSCETKGRKFNVFKDLSKHSPLSAFYGHKNYIHRHETIRSVLKVMLNERREASESHLFLYRATKPFELKERSGKNKKYKVLDAIWNEFAREIIIKDKKPIFTTAGKYISFSYGKSILSNIIPDIGATPLSYWEIHDPDTLARMQQLKIPFEKVRVFIKNNFLFIPPQFGILDLFLGGEFHDRSCLPSECFNTETKEPIQNKISVMSVAIGVKDINSHKKSYLILNSYKRPKSLERDFFKDVWLPHVQILDDHFHPGFYEADKNLITKKFKQDAQKALIDGVVIPEDMGDDYE